MADNSYTDIMEKNHMEIPWHDYARQDGNILIDKAGLIEKASVIGRVGLIMLSCGTGAWRVRTSMNRLSKVLGVTCTVDVGLMSIEFNCFDGTDCISQSLSIANTGVNTSKLYRMEQFVDNFPNEEAHLTGEEIHRRLDEIEQIHAIYSPARLIMSFFGVFGFSIMFNSPASMAATAALIGAIANSLRLELVDLTGMPAPAAAFAGALTAGLLASFIKENNGYPRISLTVPSIVIMVPGLYLYRAIYNFGIMALSDAVSWFASAIMIIIALPLGLIFARILTDKTFRYCT